MMDISELSDCSELLYLYDLKWKLVDKIKKSESNTNHLELELREVEYWINEYLKDNEST